MSEANRIAVVVALLTIMGCAGRSAHPVMVYQPGDASRSCGVLERELQLIEDEVSRLLPQTDKAAKNTGLGVAGIFLLVPIFFMDLSKAEQVEVNALTQRYNHLLGISNANNCGLSRNPIPDFKKTEY